MNYKNLLLTLIILLPLKAISSEYIIIENKNIKNFQFRDTVNLNSLILKPKIEIKDLERSKTIQDLEFSNKKNNIKLDLYDFKTPNEIEITHDASCDINYIVTDNYKRRKIIYNNIAEENTIIFNNSIEQFSNKIRLYNLIRKPYYGENFYENNGIYVKYLNLQLNRYKYFNIKSTLNSIKIRIHLYKDEKFINIERVIDATLKKENNYTINIRELLYKNNLNFFGDNNEESLFLYNWHIAYIEFLNINENQISELYSASLIKNLKKPNLLFKNGQGEMTVRNLNIDNILKGENKKYDILEINKFNNCNIHKIRGIYYNYKISDIQKNFYKNDFKEIKFLTSEQKSQIYKQLTYPFNKIYINKIDGVESIELFNFLNKISDKFDFEIILNSNYVELIKDNNKNVSKKIIDNLKSIMAVILTFIIIFSIVFYGKLKLIIEDIDKKIRISYLIFILLLFFCLLTYVKNNNIIDLTKIILVSTTIFLSIHYYNFLKNKIYLFYCLYIGTLLFLYKYFLNSTLFKLILILYSMYLFYIILNSWLSYLNNLNTKINYSYKIILISLFLLALITNYIDVNISNYLASLILLILIKFANE
jgi:hypothetical protein